MATITFVDKPAPISTSNAPTFSAEAAKARALAILTGSSSNTAQPAQQPVQNQSNIAVEELAAVKQPQETQQKQQPTQETAQPDSNEAATESPKEEPISSQFAILARKEKALRAKAVAQEQQYKARESALAAREAELAAKSNQDLSNYVSKDKLKQNALGVLADLGIDYDKLAQDALTYSTPEAQAIRQYKLEMEQELQKVREEQANTRKSFEQQQAQAYQQAVNQIKNEVKQLVSSDPSFETIKETGSVNDVVELIERTFKEEGTLLTVEQAAQAVEDYLVEEALKISKIRKVQERLKPVVARPTAAQSQATGSPNEQSNKGDPNQQQMKTLTNAVSVTRPLTARERALRAFKGEN